MVRCFRQPPPCALRSCTIASWWSRVCGRFQRSTQRDHVFGGSRCLLVVCRRALAGGLSRWPGSSSWICSLMVGRCSLPAARSVSAGRLLRFGRTARPSVGQMARSGSCHLSNPALCAQSPPGSCPRRNGFGSPTWPAAATARRSLAEPSAGRRPRSAVNCAATCIRRASTGHSTRNG